MLEGLTGADGGLAAVGILLAAALVAGLFYLGLHRRNSPAERERKRRVQVAREGRIIDGTVTDVRRRDATLGQPEERLIHYHYRISGVNYSTVQDVAALDVEVGEDLAGLIGAVTVKYLTNNPYNSIVVSEAWSGLRGSKGTVVWENEAGAN